MKKLSDLTDAEKILIEAGMKLVAARRKLQPNG